MLNRIIRFSLLNRVITLVLTAVIMIAGCIVLTRSEVDIFPDLNAPTVVVMTEAPGMAPEEVEKLVTYPVEATMTGAKDIRRTRSQSNTGFSVVWVEFNWGTDIYHARQTVAERLASVAETLPPGVGTPVMGPQSSILGEMLIVGFTPKTTSMLELRKIVDRDVARQLLATEGVAQVSVIGGQANEMQILLSPEKMKFHGATLGEVLEAIDNANANATGSVLYAHGNEYLLKGAINSSSAEDLSNLAVPLSSGKNIRLGDVARVVPGGATPRIGTASVKGRESVLLTVTKQPGVGTIELTRRLEDKLAQIKNSLPADVEMSTDIFRQSDFISGSISNLQTSLLEGALMVILVLFFFLMNLRTTLISVVALPLSIIITILILRAMGVTINTMSLGGIAIAIGSLVDDAIVDVENVYKRLRQNFRLPKEERQTTLQVVYNASREVRKPIFNSSLVIVASFLPLFFLTGMEGRMLLPLGVSFIVALAASTLVALTLTPVLCSYLLGGNVEKDDSKDSKELSRDPWITRKLRSAYSRSLAWSLDHARTVMWSVGGLFAVSLALFFTLGRSFLPDFNEGSLTINVSTLPGIALDQSDSVGRLAERIILSMPEISTTARKTGRAELDEHSLGVNVSEIEAPYRLSGRSRGEMVAQLRHELSEIPGTSIEIGQPISHRIDAMLSGTEARIAIKVFGPDLNRLYAVGREIKETIHSIEGVEDVNIEQQVERPQIEIIPRREILARYGVSMNRFSEFIDVALAGRQVSQVYEDGYPVALTVKFDGDSHADIDYLRRLPIDTRSGKVPLASVADVVSTSGPNTINRENGNRRIVVSANVEGRDLRGVVDEIRSRVTENVKMPQGYHVQYSGQFENEQSASRTLALTTLLALAIILMLLYAEFRDIRESLVILINMPLAMIGGVLILVLTRSELNIPAIIGFISLIGISTRNGMLLISRYNHLKQEGESLSRRITIGSADRLLPIIMTALTSALALIPLALRGHEPGNEIQSPLAVVILGGLISSTALNIYVVPILYRYISRSRKSPADNTGSKTTLEE